MSNIDSAMKEFLEIDEVFAQLFTKGLFHDQVKVKADELLELDSATAKLFSTKDGKIIGAERFRDIVKLSKLGVAFQVVLGIEEQTKVNYYMPVRCMQYDAFRYDAQCRHIAAKKKEKHKDFQYADGVPKGTKIIPIITLVFYIGEKFWDGPKELWDMFEITNENHVLMERYVHNYGMHLIDARHMDDTNIDTYEGDLKAFLAMLKDKEKKTDVIARHRETWYALSIVKNDKRYKEYIDNISDEELKGGVNMCATLDYFETKGREEGREEGRYDVNKLNQKLADLGRVDDIIKAAKDSEYQKKLMKELDV